MRDDRGRHSHGGCSVANAHTDHDVSLALAVAPNQWVREAHRHRRHIGSLAAAVVHHRAEAASRDRQPGAQVQRIGQVAPEARVPRYAVKRRHDTWHARTRTHTLPTSALSPSQRRSFLDPRARERKRDTEGWSEERRRGDNGCERNTDKRDTATHARTRPHAHARARPHTHAYALIRTYMNVPPNASGWACKGFRGTAPPDGGFGLMLCLRIARSTWRPTIASILSSAPSVLHQEDGESLRTSCADEVEEERTIQSSLSVPRLAAHGRV